ncbi:MAG: PLP-dependent aminotransferase family protein [Ardenticatenaceae bacterium]|nr:PLP-dependent aminotransferase family protein [Ardenticatenaceae bacterium]
MSIAWDEFYSSRVRWLKDSVTMDLRRIMGDPNVISFFAGLPDPALYPVEDIRLALDHVMAEQGREVLQHAPPAGDGLLKSYLTEKLRRGNVPAQEENMLVLSGSIQGLDLVAEMLLDPGDAVIVEDPTFSGALEVFAKYGARFITVPVDDEGLQVESLAATLLQQRAKFLYTMPTCHNPTGVDLSLARRRRLLAIAREFGLPLVTDDPYGELRYRGTAPPELLALDGEANVIMIGSFSKILAPGLRLGWLLAPSPVVETLRLEKLSADRSTNHLVQRLAAEMARQGMLDRYRETMVTVYGEKLEAILAAMRLYFPPAVKWTTPCGGYFIWVTLPVGLDASLLLERALAQQVAFIPGASFFAAGGGENTLRLCFVNTPLAQIPEGIQRLGRLITELIDGCGDDSPA